MRIVIADDSLLLREGVALLLGDADHEVVASVADGDAFVAAMLEHRPDLGIVDVRMPPTHTDEGLRAAIEVLDRWPTACVLVLSQFVERARAMELLDKPSGGIGYLLKDRISDIDAFLESLDQIRRGNSVIDPQVVRQLMTRPADTGMTELTPREREVMELVAEGLSNAGIAQRLVVSEGAVEKHIQRIFGKLGLLADADVHRRVAAVRTYLRA